jgi:hypothetical protein
MCPSNTPLLTCPVVTTSLIAAAQTYSSLLMLVVAPLLPTLFYRFANKDESTSILEISHIVRTNLMSIPPLLMAAEPDCDGPAFR